MSHNVFGANIDLDEVVGWGWQYDKTYSNEQGTHFYYKPAIWLKGVRDPITGNAITDSCKTLIGKIEAKMELLFPNAKKVSQIGGNAIEDFLNTYVPGVSEKNDGRASVAGESP